MTTFTVGIGLGFDFSTIQAASPAGESLSP